MATERALQAIRDVLKEELDVVNLAVDKVNDDSLKQEIKEALDELNMEDLYSRYNDLGRKRVEECYNTLKEKVGE